MPKDQSVDLETIDQSVVFEGRVWNVVTDTFDFGGQKLARDYIKHPGAVAVICINEANEILMIRQYRRPVGKFLWELPAGLLDVVGEPEVEAAKRELAEEAGFAAGHIEHLVTFHPSPGGNSETITIFFAKDLVPIEYDFEKTGEEVDLQPTWIPINEAIASVMASEIKNSISMLAILTLARKIGL